MTDFRPICDTWILARPKVKYYGAYPSGFLERARNLLGVGPNDAVLHVCSGAVRQYPFRGFGPHDLTMDMDPLRFPTFVHDAQEHPYPTKPYERRWRACLCDPPYSPDEATHYNHKQYPVPARILKAAGLSIPVGGRVGFLHRKIPRPPKWMRPVAYIGVIVGYENDIRCYSVFERTS